MYVCMSTQNPGDAWFWHPDVEYMTASQLWNIYMLTIGRGANLILNLPPNASGLVPENFVKEVTALGNTIASLQPHRAVAVVNATAPVTHGGDLSDRATVSRCHV